MAELAFGIAEKVLEKLESSVYQELRLACGVKSDVERLKGTMSTIKNVLLDAEEKQATDRKLRDWLGQLKDVFYNAEDVLDEIHCEALRKQVVKTYGSTGVKVRNYFSCSSSLPLRFKLGHKIKGIRERLDQIAAEKDQFNLVERREDGNVMTRLRDMTHSFVDPSAVIGREKEKKEIIDLLLRSDPSKNVNVIPIVGLVGVGKTALAKTVYNDGRVVSHFQLRMWVCVSEDFNLTRLVKEILKSAGLGFDEDSSTVEMLQTSLRELIKKRKFLLVLDDVWNDEISKWIELRDLLVGGSKVSKILVTTRSHSVASIMGTVPSYTLKCLSQKDCLSLFVRWAFKEGEDKKYPNLFKIGEDIVKKCNGVPLAVRTLGCLLYSKFDEREWQLVRENEIWQLEEKEGGILPALRLSYNQLPIHLKRCFAYCSLFPKGHIFFDVDLIQFWMAHGLILQTPANKKQEFEDVGSLYIKQLMSICFFQDVEEIPPFGYSFKMHDLVLNLAHSVTQGECSVVDSDNKSITATVRHLSFSGSGQELSKHLDKLTSVRTAMFQTTPQLSLLEACILRFEYLRVLNLSRSSLGVLPSSIDTLKHLRYLNLSDNERIQKLPNSICKLHNLQTLLLVGCLKLERLPKDLRNMISLRLLTITMKNTCLSENGVCCLNSLRFLSISRCPRLEIFFQQMDGSLTKLQTLIVADCESLTSLSLNIKHLTALENLFMSNCGELCLTGGEENQDLFKLRLQRLGISTLPKLEVLPDWLQGSADTLKHLLIEGCENFSTLPEWLPGLKSLQTLKIFSCPKLTSLPEGMQNLTELREFTVSCCYELSQKCKQEDWPKISHVPKVYLDELRT